MATSVRLEYATAQAFSVGGSSFSYTYARVKVANLVYQKEVGLRRREGPVWRDEPLPWIGNYNDHDIFATPDARSTPFTAEFAVFILSTGRRSGTTTAGRTTRCKLCEHRSAGTWRTEDPRYVRE